MTGIKYFALDENEEVPYEFVVTRNVNGKPEFCASFVNTNTLAYGNGVLLKFHQRNDELRAENDRLRWKLEVLKAHGIEIVDAVAGGYEIYSDDHKEAERLKAENAKLLELVRLLLWGVDNDMPRYEELAWTQKVNVLVRELGIDVD